MLRRKCTSYDRVGYLKDMQKYLTLFNIAVANKIMLVNRDDLNLAIDKLEIILKNSIIASWFSLKTQILSQSLKLLKIIRIKIFIKKVMTN